jgi:hypothetical protein
MPCCCGPKNAAGRGCSETIEFFQKAHIAGLKSVDKFCVDQYPGFVHISEGGRMKKPMIGLVIFYMLFSFLF